VKDNRHWPASRGAAPESPEGQQPGLNLEKLKLRFENNVYFAAPGRGWFKWGPTWSRHQTYPTLKDFQSELAIDRESQVLDPGFADLLQLDFRVRGETMKQLKESYPCSPVPAVKLTTWP